MSVMMKDASTSTAPTRRQIAVSERLSSILTGSAGATSADATHSPPALAASSANQVAVSKPMPGLIPSSLLAVSSLALASDSGSSDNGLQALDGSDVVSSGQPKNLTNTKEKNPMCLVNELARLNKVPLKYTLTNEQGPAHQKTFSVTLQVGEEVFSAQGLSIKKAQHLAAALALERTAYRRPQRRAGSPFNTNKPAMTPTVELNVLAMKLGAVPEYYQLEPCTAPPPPLGIHNSQHWHTQPYLRHTMDFRGLYNQRYHNYPRPPPSSPRPPLFCTALRVGSHEFVAEGATRQLARHNAAAKALALLRTAVPIPPTSPSNQLQHSEEVELLSGVLAARVGGDDSALLKEDEEHTEICTPHDIAITSDEAPVSIEADGKSEISIVHELASRHRLDVSFEVRSEVGPPHSPHFVTRCTCGEFSTEGEGENKRVSKKEAAIKMLKELKTLLPLPQVSRPKLKNNDCRKKSRSIMKIQKMNADYGSSGIHPISRLIQIQQAKKESEPVFELTSERRLLRCKEFVIKVRIGELEASGSGPNKKLAKRHAAEGMLQLMGCSQTMPAPPFKSLLKPADSTPGGSGMAAAAVMSTAPVEKKVTFVDEENRVSKTSPGAKTLRCQPLETIDCNQSDALLRGVCCSTATICKMAKELLKSGCSATAEALLTGLQELPDQAKSTPRPKEQLEYLAKAAGFKIEFVDVPKGTNRKEYLALVSLVKDPPQANHGIASTVEESHDAAALAALRQLAAADEVELNPHAS